LAVPVNDGPSLSFRPILVRPVTARRVGAGASTGGPPLRQGHDVPRLGPGRRRPRGRLARRRHGRQGRGLGPRRRFARPFVRGSGNSGHGHLRTRSRAGLCKGQHLRPDPSRWPSATRPWRWTAVRPHDARNPEGLIDRFEDWRKAGAPRGKQPDESDRCQHEQHGRIGIRLGRPLPHPV